MQVSKKSPIVIIGGCLVRKNYVGWRTTNFDEGDNFGIIGDRLRVVAATYLHKADPDEMVIALGGRGQYEYIPDVPPIATIVKQELITLGVPKDKIVVETESGNTFQQLQALVTIIEKKGIERIRVISNKYHLPRVKALSGMIAKLGELFAGGKFDLISAEQVLLKHNPEEWQASIEAAYLSEPMKSKIEQEERGIQMIKNGTYKMK